MRSWKIPTLARCTCSRPKHLPRINWLNCRILSKRLDDSFGVFTYDGDTPSDARKAIRERGHIVLSNPDMLHTGILPHHTKWMRLFENLRYIVLDELHTYRGVFGSHLANVLRRLKRVAKFYGSDPQFICCSATIANPGELASQLIEKEVEVVEENGAPAGEKIFVFYNPPMVNRNLGIRRSYINEATRVAKEILARKLQTIVFANSRLHTEVMLTYLQQANPPKPGQAEPIRGYRGGYLPGERREIERGLRDGRILRSGRYKRARTGNRCWFARCLRDGRISGIDCFDLADGPAARDGAEEVRARYSSLPRLRSISSSCSIPTTSSGARPSTPTFSPTISKFS